MPGVGLLLERTGVPAVPVWIEGTFEVLAPGSVCRGRIRSASASGRRLRWPTWSLTAPKASGIAGSPSACAKVEELAPEEPARNSASL